MDKVAVARRTRYADMDSAAARRLCREGLAFERRVAESLPGWEHKVCMRWRGSRREIDLLRVFEDFAVILEVKRTFTLAAYSKLRSIYIPMTRRRLGIRDVYGLQVAKFLTDEARGVRHVSLDEFIRKPTTKPCVWHHPFG